MAITCDFTLADLFGVDYLKSGEFSFPYLHYNIVSSQVI